VGYLWYAALGLITLLCLDLFSKKDRSFLVFLVGLSTLLVMVFFSLNIIRTGAVSAGRSRFGISAFKDYNAFVFALLTAVMLIMIGVSRIVEKKNYLKGTLYLGLIIGITGFGVISGSRRTLLFYIPITLLVPLWLSWQKNKRLLIVFITIIVFLIAIAAFLFSSKELDPGSIGTILYTNLDSVDLAYAQHRLTRTLNPVVELFGLDSSQGMDVSVISSLLEGRFRIWELTWGRISSFSALEVLLGRGTNSFYAPTEMGIYSPHNFLLSAIYEGGLVKLIILLLFLAAWIFHLLKILPRCNFWTGTFLLAFNMIWLGTNLISGDDFFSSRSFVLMLVIYSASWMESQKIL
jgi:hypothetical protein